MTKCPYCPRSMQDNADVSRHVSQTKACQEARLAKMNQIKAENWRALRQIDMNGDQKAPMQVNVALGGGLDMDVDMDMETAGSSTWPQTKYFKTTYLDLRMLFPLPERVLFVIFERCTQHHMAVMQAHPSAT